jgi:hypothetical protein
MMELKFYTVTSDYYATGEGRHIAALICQAYTPELALERFTREYGEFYARSADVVEGVEIGNPICMYLFGSAALNNIGKLYNCPILKASLDYNLS